MGSIWQLARGVLPTHTHIQLPNRPGLSHTPGGGSGIPPRELNNLNPGGSPVFKLFNSRPRASPPDPLPQDLNYLNYVIPGPN